MLPPPFDSPLGVAVLAAVIGAIVKWQRGLSYREVVTLQTIANRLYPVLDLVASRYGRPLTRRKRHPDRDPDFYDSLPVSPREFVREIRPPFQPQLLSTAKWRREAGAKRFIHSQWVYYHDDGQQTHVYLWAVDGGVEVYAHVEPSVRVPDKHHLGDQESGDARGALADALGR